MHPENLVDALGAQIDQKSAKNRFFPKNSENSNDFLSESVPTVKIGPVVYFLQRIKVGPYFGRFHNGQKKIVG